MGTTPVLDVREPLNSGEQLFAKLERLTAAHRRVDLRLPLRMSPDSFGGDAVVMQLTATWMEVVGSTSTLRLRLTGDETPGELRQVLASAPHLLFAVMLDARIHGNLDVDLTSRLRTVAVELLESRREDARELVGPDLVSARHFGLLTLVADSEPGLAPSSIYATGHARNLVTEPTSDYYHLASRAYQLRDPKSSVAPTPAQVSSLSWAIFELFQNTHEWATRRILPDGREETIPNSVRAIHVRARRLDTSAFDPAVVNTFFARYVNAVAVDGIAELLEISIIDTGFGIARRRATITNGFNFDAEQELAALRWAMAVRRTESYDHLKGIGYHRTLILLGELRGHLQVRSGRLFALRDLVATAYPTELERQSAVIGDAVTWTDLDDGLGVVEGSPFGVRPASASGTRVTLHVPLRGATIGAGAGK